MSRYTTEWENNLLVSSGLEQMLGPTVLYELRELHNAEGRFYHNWDHALDVLKAVLQLRLPTDKERAYALAAVFHDSIYTFGRMDNESNSVILMESKVPKSELRAAASGLIMYTSMHMRSSINNIPPYGQDFLDCDMLSIASPCWPIALGYEHAIYNEAIAAGRSQKNVLEMRMQFFNTMMVKPTIFLGHHYGSTNEWQARLNIHRLQDYYLVQNHGPR